MTKVIYPINEFSINLLKHYDYLLDPTHDYWFKKISDDVEIEIQNRDNDLYIKGQVIIHCENATIIDDLVEIKHILTLCTKRSDNND